MIVDRIPFEQAIRDPKLLGKAFYGTSTQPGLSLPQQTALKIFYGLPLDETELRYYSMFMNDATFDELGYVTGVNPATNYREIEHDEAWVIFGRRSAKTSNFLSFILVYEALLGGHTKWKGRAGQQIVSFIVAQKLGIAQAIIRDFIEPLVASSPTLVKEIEGEVNKDGIIFKNGHRINPSPPVIKNFRYYAIPVVAMDECSFWYKDAEAANPDYEVIRAAKPAQMQFPYRKLVGASTVFSKEGILWDAKNAGCYGRNLPTDEDEQRARFKTVLVLQAPTAAMENPLVDRKFLLNESVKDPEAFKREYLNIPSDSASGMFTESLLRQATENAPKLRPYQEGYFYIASLDPAFRADNFTFCIGHYEEDKGFVQDLLKAWVPQKGGLNPSIILDEIKMDLAAYQVQAVYSDQYQLESLQQLAIARGFSIIGMDFTANSKSKFFGSFLQLLRHNKVKLLRNYEQFQEFLWVQRVEGNGGYIRITHPVGKHDDRVTVTVLCCSQAIQFGGSMAKDTEQYKVPTLLEQVMTSHQTRYQQHKDNDGYL